MESLWQAVLQACMHWLCDTLHSGVLLKFPSSLPFCSAGRIMSNKQRSKWAETKQELSLSQKHQLSGQNLMKIRPRCPPWHRKLWTNRPRDKHLIFKWHKRLLSVPMLHLCKINYSHLVLLPSPSSMWECPCVKKSHVSKKRHFKLFKKRRKRFFDDLSD